MIVFEGALALFLVVATGCAASERVQSDWDPEEGLPSWYTIGLIGMLALGAVAAFVLDLRA